MSGDVTQLLGRVADGDDEAVETLLPLVYNELHRRATSLMRRESSGHTLQPTALAHDAFLVLVGQDRTDWKSRAHFFALASQAMRRLLVDHARGRLREKRGGGAVKIQLDESLGLSVQRDADVLALHDALQELEKVDERQAAIVSLRFFGGLSVEEVATVMKLSKRTVEAEWTMVKAWLRRAINEDS